MRLALIAVTLLLPGTAAAADLTAEVGGGVAMGVDRIAPGTEVSRTDRRFGFTIPSLGFGAFFTPDFAMLLRVQNTALRGEHGFGHQTLFALAAQVWFDGRLFISGGIGAAAIGRGGLIGLGRHERTGVGLDFRVGVALARADRNVLAAYFGWTPAWYAETNTYVASNLHALTLGLDWQLDRDR